MRRGWEIHTTTQVQKPYTNLPKILRIVNTDNENLVNQYLTDGSNESGRKRGETHTHTHTYVHTYMMTTKSSQMITVITTKITT